MCFDFICNSSHTPTKHFVLSVAAFSSNDICECTGKRFFPFNERALIIRRSERFKSGFELLTFHLLETRGSGGMLPRENLDF